MTYLFGKDTVESEHKPSLLNPSLIDLAQQYNAQLITPTLNEARFFQWRAVESEYSVKPAEAARTVAKNLIATEANGEENTEKYIITDVTRVLAALLHTQPENIIYGGIPEWEHDQVKNIPSIEVTLKDSVTKALKSIGEGK